MSNTTHTLPISLIRGGSLYWIQEKAGLVHAQTWDLRRRLPLVTAVAWLPLVVLAATHGGLADVRALLVDYRVYARVFIAIPLLLIVQITMDVRFREMAAHFLEATLIRAEDLTRFDEIMKKTARLRDAKLPELIALVAVYAQVGYFLEGGRLRYAAWAVDQGTQSITAAGYYSLLVPHALFLLLSMIALWKWVLWVYVLRQISKMHLQLDATNGDLTAGLGFLGDVPRAFVPFLVAVSAVMAANWRSQILAGQVTLDSLTWPAAALAVLMLLIFFVPLGLFSPALIKEKRESTRTYGTLQHLFSLQFRGKWSEHRQGHLDDLLGVPDFSALADLSSAFKNIEQMIPFPVRKGSVVAFALALVVPMIPVITTQIPLREILKQLFEAIH